jgi:hypothetical protein
MTEQTYNIKDVIEIQFRNLSKEMTEIKALLKDQNTQVEKQFARIDIEMKEIKDKVDILSADNARYKLIIGVGATIGATVFTFLLNKIF